MVNKRILYGCISLAILSSTAQAASISAESGVCNGFFGLASAPRLNCGTGNADGDGVAVIGGSGVSGVGSGINVPFRINNVNTEFSASAAALQDFGIFHGYANLYVQEQDPGIFGGAYRAYASGEFIDTWTINGGGGLGRLKLGFSLTGGGSVNIVSTGGGDVNGQADLRISVSLNNLYGGGIVAQQAGTYDLLPDGPNALIFTFGVPFKLSVSNTVTAGGGYNRLNPPTFFQLDADAFFENTSILSSIAATDIFGNEVPNISLIAESGTHYPLAVPDPTVVPIPGSFALFGIAVTALGLLRRRRSLA
ncbi:MAG: hypothetical protein KGZ88_17810 [Methylomicrobium sp.]|nr:hypothetical protein [Methylomicrobium sp.]